MPQGVLPALGVLAECPQMQNLAHGDCDSDTRDPQRGSAQRPGGPVAIIPPAFALLQLMSSWARSHLVVGGMPVVAT